MTNESNNASRISGVNERVSVGSAMASMFAIVACCAWIACAVFAHAVVGGRDGVVRGTSDLFVGGCLAAGVVVASGVLGIGGTSVAGALYAVTVAGLVADGRLAQWDAVAAFLALSGAALSGSAGSRWGGALLLGLACACSPLCAGALVAIVVWRSDDVRSAKLSPRGLKSAARVLSDVAIIALMGVAGALAIESFAGREPIEAFATGSEAARMGTHDVWRLVARWLELVLGVFVLAMLAASAWFYDDESGASGAALNRFEKGLVCWVIVNVLVGLIQPRVVVDHGLLFALPGFLLVPAGWRLLRTLPMDRSHWTMSLFTVGCHVLPFALLWYPVRKVLEVGIVAIYPP